jgi:L-gulonate 3-dehydrogenase
MAPADSSTSPRIAIVGGGTIGVAFALVFARAGHAVSVHDPDAGRRGAVLRELSDRLSALAAFDLLDEPAVAILARVRVAESLEACVEGAVHVQECAPETLELKRGLFGTLDRITTPDAALASASSAITASRFAAELPGRARCLVAHPINPPHLIPVVEIVPAPFTAPEVTARTEALLARAGMTPVVVGAELEGFVFNRLQGALLREAYCLVRDGVASVEAIDKLVRDGLGLRWSVIGPFETADLNVRGGIAAHAERMGPAYERMGAERGQHDPWTPELVAKVAAARREALPLEQWPARAAWRDRALMALLRLRRQQRL